jgi:hypothetical protein
VALQLGGHCQQFFSRRIEQLRRVAVALGVRSNQAADTHGAAEAHPPPDRDRRAHPQGALATETAEGHRGGVVFVGGLGALGRHPRAHLGVERQGHAERVEAGAEVGRRCRDASDHRETAMR